MFEIALGVMCIVSACSIFLGHALGYRTGKRDGYRKGIIAEKNRLAKRELNEIYGKGVSYETTDSVR